MRKFLQLVTVGASALAALASASSNRHPVEVSGAESDFGHGSMPPLVRHQLVRPDGTSKIDIVAIPAGATGWDVRVKNTTGGLVSVLWDESTFVTSSGESTGRLIRGETRRMDIGKSQPTTPIAPGSLISETVFPESLIDSEESEGKLMEMNFLSNASIAKFTRLRSQEQALITGGKLVVTFEVGGTKTTWTGVVESTDEPIRSAAKGGDLERP